MFLFNEFAKHVKVRNKSYHIDALTFRLYYRLSFWFFIGCTLLVCTREIIKEHIACDVNVKDWVKPINTYCFIKATFTLPKYANETIGGRVAHPGVGPQEKGDETKYHSYYQWVPYVLFFHALLCYIPHYLWKNLEGGRLMAFVRGIEQIQESPENSKQEEQKRCTFQPLMRFRINRDWAYKLILCEALNLILLMFQVWLIDTFLQGGFLTLGFDWWSLKSDDVLNTVFPKVTKCTYYKYGASGTIQNHDYICVLPLNLLNTWIYGIVWYWFFFLSLISAVGLGWRLICWCLHSNRVFSRYVWGEVNPGQRLNPEDVEIISKYFLYADWLFLHYIAKNLNGKKFRQFFRMISQDVQSGVVYPVEVSRQKLSEDMTDSNESTC